MQDIDELLYDRRATSYSKEEAAFKMEIGELLSLDARKFAKNAGNRNWNPI